MKLALVGYGKMGRAVETVALEKGHEVVARIDPTLDTHDISAETLGGAEVAIEFTVPGDRHVLEVTAIDRRRAADHLPAFATQGDERVIIEIAAEHNRSAGRGVKVEVAGQPNRAGQVAARRDMDRSAASGGTGRNGLVDGIGVVRFTVGASAEIHDIAGFHGSSLRVPRSTV